MISGEVKAKRQLIFVYTRKEAHSHDITSKLLHIVCNMSNHKFIKIEAYHLNKVADFVHENFCKRGQEPLATMLSDDDAEYTDTPSQIKKWSADYIKAGHSWMICDEHENILAVSLNFIREALYFKLSDNCRSRTPPPP